MTIFEEIVDAFRATMESIAQIRMPPVIAVKHSDSSPMAGHDLGLLVLERTSAGSSYRLDRPARADLAPAVNSLTRNHYFTDLADFAKWLDKSLPAASAFVKINVGAAQIEGLDEAFPEFGKVTMAVPRHPIYMRWLSGTGGGEKDLTHSELADLLLDNREDLTDAAIADHLAAFRMAKTISYDANLGDGGHEGVKVSWKGSGGQEGASSTMLVPREIKAALPAYCGAWPPGEEPRHTAIFRLRVLPPIDGAAPLFRIMWVNYAEYDLDAGLTLTDRVREVCGDRAVYSGSPFSAKVILPK